MTREIQPAIFAACRMANAKQQSKKKPAANAGMPHSVASDQKRLGRRLFLRFTGRDKPVLDRVEFRGSDNAKPSFLQIGVPDHNFRWGEVAQALSMLFLEYLCSFWEGNSETFAFLGKATDSPAASFANALYPEDHFLRKLFVEGDKKLLRVIIGGDNLGGNDKTKPRCIRINADQLPPDCVEVFWDAFGVEQLTKVEQINALADRLHRSLGIERPVRPKASKKKIVTDLPPPPPFEASPQVTESSPRPSPTVVFPDSFLKSIEALAEAATRNRQNAPSAQKPPRETEAGSTKAQEPEFDVKPPPTPVLPPIDPRLFVIQSDGESWEDDEPLLSFDSSDLTDYWTIRNASEGVLILGTTGSGKTTGSGATIAKEFLKVGYGGLVLAVKPEEADYWRNLCAETGREQDLMVLNFEGPYRCNLLAYEAQRPGRGRGYSLNLIAFFRTLLRILNRQAQAATDEQFWQAATDQLMHALFEVFIVAGRQVTIHEMADFVVNAPSKPGEALTQFPAELFLQAKENIASDEDCRQLSRAFDYWTRQFPKIPSKTRQCIVASFMAMADLFQARDVHNLLSTETTFAPEMILSGKIVVLDFPLKMFHQVGLVVQSAFKYLFQLAIESRSDKGASRRPVFLWEDEAQYFFSEYDPKFQQTARAFRACDVILSQNLSNFYLEFGNRGRDLVNSAFANHNTQIFHANNDTITNQWAADHFGTEMRTYFNTSVASRPVSALDSIGFPKPAEWTISSQKVREYPVHPHEFALLRMGGPDSDFEVDAYIYRVGKVWKKNGKPFLKVTFSQI